MSLSRRKFLKEAVLGTAAIAVPILSACRRDQALPPELPANTIPNPPNRLQVIESLRAVTLIWDAPQTNTDGSPLSDLQSYQIFRKRLPDGDFQYLYETDRSATIFIDTSVRETEVVYQVVAKTNRGATSAQSEPSPSAKAQMKIRSLDVPSLGTRSLFEGQGNRVTEPTAAVVSVEHRSNGEFLAIELICTHAGCGGMNSDGKNWTCRCHGSKFDNDGNVVQAPATVPLFRLIATRATSGDLILRAF
jgi:Rieske Fe-S protein